MPDLLTVEGIEVKRESTYNTDPVPGTGNGVRLAKNCWNTMNPSYNWQNDRGTAISGAIIPVKRAIPRGRYVSFDLYVEIKGPGSDVSPESAELLVACGLPETHNVGASWTYGTLTSSTKGSCTIYAYSGGKLFKVTGCRGTCRLELVAGELAVMHFSMIGMLSTDPTQTALAGITYQSTEPPAAVTSTFTIGTWTPDLLSATVDFFGKKPEILPSATATDGIQAIDFGDSDPQVEIIARSVSLATYDPYGDLKARTSRTLVMTLGPAVAWSRLKIISGTVSLIEHDHQDSQGFTNWRLLYQLEAGGTWQFD